MRRPPIAWRRVTRRAFLGTLAAAGAGGALLSGGVRAESAPTVEKPIPSSGETIPVIGMGSSRTFDVRDDPADRESLAEVLRLFFEAGGRAIDTSPMYGNAESVLGDLLGAPPVSTTPGRERLFAATKVWTDGRDAGVAQMQRSEQRMGVARFDLIQIHNLRDWKAHLPTLREWKEQGRVRYVGITTSHGRYHDELEGILQREPFDFVQLSYSLGNREAERRLLPLAAEKGIAVLANRPFERGSMFRMVRDRPLPDWAAEMDCKSWAQAFLKFAVSHPAVTCAIPATSKPKHMRDNMGANRGRLPDADLRARIVAYWKSL